MSCPLHQNRVMLPVSFLAVSNSLIILVNWKKCIFRILQILLTAGCVIYLWNIVSFIQNKIATMWMFFNTTAKLYLGLTWYISYTRIICLTICCHTFELNVWLLHCWWMMIFLWVFFVERESCATFPRQPTLSRLLRVYLWMLVSKF